MITTLILIIAFSIHKNDTVQQEEPKQEAASKTVAEAQNSTQIPMDTETETEPATEQNNTEQADTQKPTEKQKENETSVVSASTEEKASEQKTSETKSSEEKTSEKNTPAAATEKVRFEVGGGEYSDVICKRLLQAGLIDDADAFNKFLIQKDYDNLILPGVYDIPKGATYEEIAALLTTKVEGETAQ